MGEFRLVHYHAIIYFVVCANSSVTGADSCKDESVSSVGQKWSEQPKFKLPTRLCHRHVQSQEGPEATTCQWPTGLIILNEAATSLGVLQANAGADQLITMSFCGRAKALIGNISRCLPDTRMTYGA